MTKEFDKEPCENDSEMLELEKGIVSTCDPLELLHE